MIQKALAFAAKMHEGQYRKGMDVPYIVHPAEVMYYLAKAQATDDMIAAGLLHDIIEDTPVTREKLADIFGENITRLVISQSEDKTKTWAERKAATEEKLLTASEEELLLCCADKLSNLKSIYTVGEAVWQCFKGTREQTKNHFTRLKQLYEPLKYERKYKTAFIYDDFIKYYSLVFGDK